MAQAASLSPQEREEVYKEFRGLVNMSPTQLEQWLQTDESQEVGYRHEGDSESVGHESGRYIVQLLHRKKSDFTDEDYHRMRKVSGFIKRHLAQRPSGNINETHWRYSLMNWGHDPKQD